MKINDLNKERLGNLLCTIPAHSFDLGHKKVNNTMKNYWLPQKDDLEQQFLFDLFNLDTEEIIDKWYDGEDSASDFLMSLL
ncbi:hypothetical protein MOB18_21285 [Bacillus inaquosorum]|uniref:hypothetical protein n=1 Tax=Bacillus inaquosorum TaxID=483913 RepID=UPI002281D61C|nr:hypothetical protein [Bacillus inaquosorum]MCY7751597.1 hypothetical protein [Bacillus inaquosorum]MCY9063240.1 hypothetical protein [Bacillus inaquosorum]